MLEASFILCLFHILAVVFHWHEIVAYCSISPSLIAYSLLYFLTQINAQAVYSLVCRLLLRFNVLRARKLLLFIETRVHLTSQSFSQVSLTLNVNCKYTNESKRPLSDTVAAQNCIV